jgi:hypothetical protein
MQTQLAANIRENSAITNALFRKDFVALKAKLFDAVRYVAPLTRISKRNEKKHARVEKKSQCGEGFFHFIMDHRELAFSGLSFRQTRSGTGGTEMRHRLLLRSALVSAMGVATLVTSKPAQAARELCYTCWWADECVDSEVGNAICQNMGGTVCPRYADCTESSVCPSSPHSVFIECGPEL